MKSKLDINPPHDKLCRGIKLIFGLGNPGKDYANTYHNAGDLFVKFLEEKSGEDFPIALIQASKSGLFMNEIGKEVIKQTKYLKTKPIEILVAHDDVDIALGKYKLSFAKSSAGHKGVESIIKHLKTENFWRLRIGIAKKDARDKKIKAEKFVLKKISKEDLSKIEKAFEEALKEISSSL